MITDDINVKNTQLIYFIALLILSKYSCLFNILSLLLYNLIDFITNTTNNNTDDVTYVKANINGIINSNHIDIKFKVNPITSILEHMYIII